MFIRRWIQWCYDYMIYLAGKPKAMYFLFVFAFIESSFFPIPPYAMVIPMTLAHPKKAWKIATVALIASVSGGFLGYAIGMFGYDHIAKPLLTFYGYMPQFEALKKCYNDWGAWIIIFSAVTPFPYKLITIASGVMGLNIWVFSLASLTARGLRFYVIAWLLYKYGAPIEVFIEKHLGKLTLLFLILLVGGFFMLRLLG